MKRNLLFHLYPVRGSIWEWHLDQLRRRWRAFNGRKLLVVSTDGRTVSPAAVERKTRGLDADLVRLDNDPSRGESLFFIEGLRRLRSLDDREMTFYAHGKGATYSGRRSLVLQTWSDAMYFMNLSCIPLIERLMRSYSAVGCFRQELPHAGSSWHYSGNFFWFKHSALFSGDWRRLAPGRYGAEGYLGRHISVQDAYCLTPAEFAEDLYSTAVARQQCRRWRDALLRRRRLCRVAELTP